MKCIACLGRAQPQPITVTVTAPEGTEDGWQQPWHITEDPTCVFGPSASTVESKSAPLTSTTTIKYAWPDQLPGNPTSNYL